MDKLPDGLNQVRSLDLKGDERTAEKIEKALAIGRQHAKEKKQIHRTEQRTVAKAYRYDVFETEEDVAVIRLNRPDQGNTLVPEMGAELLDAANRCEVDTNVRAVVLTGNGRMFCAGADIKALTTHGEDVADYIKGMTRDLHATISRFNRMDAPVIAAINGTAAGGGFGLALSADIAIAAESAKMTAAYARTGLTLDGSCSYFLARLVGLRRAKEMALLNTVISAKQAVECGLINRVVADDQLLATTLQMAHRLAEGPTRALGETKRLMLQAATENLESQMERETLAIARIATGMDAHEGIAAFLAKRAPNFCGV